MVSVNDSEHVQTHIAKQVFNCTYSMIDNILSHSGVDKISLKHEMTEICLVRVPDEIKLHGDRLLLH